MSTDNRQPVSTVKVSLPYLVSVTPRRPNPVPNNVLPALLVSPKSSVVISDVSEMFNPIEFTPIELFTSEDASYLKIETTCGNTAYVRLTTRIDKDACKFSGQLITNKKVRTQEMERSALTNAIFATLDKYSAGVIVEYPDGYAINEFSTLKSRSTLSTSKSVLEMHYPLFHWPGEDPKFSHRFDLACVEVRNTLYMKYTNTLSTFIDNTEQLYLSYQRYGQILNEELGTIRTSLSQDISDEKIKECHNAINLIFNEIQTILFQSPQLEHLIAHRITRQMHNWTSL